MGIRVFLALLLAHAQLSLAAEYRLFTPKSVQVSNYDQTLAKLREGDVLRFSNGKAFILGAKLGQGNTTQIWEVRTAGENSAQIIRIPVASGLFGGGMSYQQYINETIHGYRRLAAHGVPLVAVTDFQEKEYVIAERLNPRLTLRQFLSKPGVDLKNDDPVTRDLVEFIRKTAHVSRIGDFHLDQLVYDDSRGWILMDWTNEMDLANNWNGDSKIHLFHRLGRSMSPAEDTLRMNWQSRILGQIEDLVDEARKNPIPRKATTISETSQKPGLLHCLKLHLGGLFR